MSEYPWADLVETSQFKGVAFFDIMPLLADADVFSDTVGNLATKVADIAGKREVENFTVPAIDQIVAIESRGFIFGSALALDFNAGFVPIRKAGNLPGETFRTETEIEYGSRELELQKNRIKLNEHVVIVDDVLGTGGSVLAAADLVTRAGGIIEGIVTLLEIPELGGRAKIEEAGYKYASVLQVHENQTN